MKTNSDFVKSRVGDKWVIVATGKTGKESSNIFELNQTSNEIYDLIEKGFTENEIAEKLSEKYGIIEAKALEDVISTIKIFTLYGIIESDKNYPQRCIEYKGEYRSKIHGSSMYPLIKNGDEVCIVPFISKPKKYDIVLYCRGEKLILHRILKILKDGRYVLRGDNNFYTEISDGGFFVGLLSEYKHGEKTYKPQGLKYNLYSFVRVHTFTLRRILVKLFKKRVRK